MPLKLLCLFILSLTSCHEDKQPNLPTNHSSPDFNTEFLTALADSARCLHAVGKIPELDLMETVIRDCLIHNSLRVSDQEGVIEPQLEYAKWKGRNIVLLLTAAETLFINLFDSITTLSTQLHKLTQTCATSSEVYEQLKELHQQIEKLQNSVSLAIQVAQNPWDSFSDHTYNPGIRDQLQDSVGLLLTINEQASTKAR